MNLHRVTTEIGFDYGHRIPDHKSKCFNVHGHRAKVKVTVEGPLQLSGSETGMVLDFAEIKRTMIEEIHDRFDHCFLAFYNDPLLDRFPEVPTNSYVTESPLIDRYVVNDFGVVQELPVVPTAENLAWICYELMKRRIERDGVRVVKVKFWETPNSMAEYRG